MQRQEVLEGVMVAMVITGEGRVGGRQRDGCGAGEEWERVRSGPVQGGSGAASSDTGLLIVTRGCF